MKTRIFLIVLFNATIHSLLANGVVFQKDTVDSYLRLNSSRILVQIENQVAITRTIQSFTNEGETGIPVKYGFPVPPNASATELRYYINGVWRTAVFSPEPQDTATGGPNDNVDEELVIYLGENPLYFDFEQLAGPDSTVVVELTYVELLEYKFGNVNYRYPNDYSRIQGSVVDAQSISIALNSDRKIISFMLLSHLPDSSATTDYHGILTSTVFEEPANLDYLLQYALSQDDLGLYSFSTFIADSLSVDDYGSGFFALVVEPDPSEQTETIQKVFTLIIDRSGSMSGNKIIQARDAATFIVEHLNENDKFNIVSFSSDITSFRSSHVEYNGTNKSAALDYINSLQATGSTNISGAFDTAIPQFSIADASTANIIIFLTDGEQTAGITDTDELINHIDGLVVGSEKEVTIFTFGIGESTNERLLTTIARNNRGLAEFLEDSELEDIITDFYLMIQNPVLLNTSVLIEPDLITERYPIELQNLYKGRQLMLFGRYAIPSNVSITFSGTAYSNDVSYTYDLELSDTTNQNYQFLTKLWAKSKIDELISQYYLNLNNSEVANEIKGDIIQISIDYGVMSPFTSFVQGGDPGASLGLNEWEADFGDRSDQDAISNEFITILSIGPNPAHDMIHVNLTTSVIAGGKLSFALINVIGQKVVAGTEFVHASGDFSFEIDLTHLALQPGIYLLVMEHRGKMISTRIVIQ